MTAGLLARVRLEEAVPAKADGLLNGAEELATAKGVQEDGSEQDANDKDGEGQLGERLAQWSEESGIRHGESAEGRGESR